MGVPGFCWYEGTPPGRHWPTHLPRRRWLRIPRFHPRAESSVHSLVPEGNPLGGLLLSPPNQVAQPSAALLRYGCGIPLAGTDAGLWQGPLILPPPFTQGRLCCSAAPQMQLIIDTLAHHPSTPQRLSQSEVKRKNAAGFPAAFSICTSVYAVTTMLPVYTVPALISVSAPSMVTVP